jgi:hypothetical protein
MAARGKSQQQINVYSGLWTHLHPGVQISWEQKYIFKMGRHEIIFYVQCLQKVFTPLDFFHILLLQPEFKIDYIYIFFCHWPSHNTP